MPRNVKLNRAGVRQVLIDDCRELVDQVTRRVAAAAGDAETESVTTDRAAGRVHVPAFDQAARGRLTRAAASVGLEVKPYKGKQ